jgi:hypothetical protein
LFLDIVEHLEALGITTNQSDNHFKVKFDASASDTQKIFALYVTRTNEIKVENRTAAQKTLLATP